MNTIERRVLPQTGVRIEDRAEGEGTPAIVGHGAVFYDGTPETEFRLFPDLVERIAPGAFDHALATKQDVRGLKNHNPDLVLGRTASDTMALSVDKRGLVYRIDAPDTQTGRDTVAEIRRGDVSASSFAFTLTEAGQKWSDELSDPDDPDSFKVSVRTITSVDRLFDTGPVTFAAYLGTDSAVRGCGMCVRTEDAEDVRAARDAWRARLKARNERADAVVAMIRKT